MNYLVTAYRFGYISWHQYYVYCGPDREKAFRLAEHEPDYRGGKYGCAVYEFTETVESDHEIAYKMIRYFPSFCGETEPEDDERGEFMKKLGEEFEYYAEGKRWVPGDAAGTIKLADITPDPVAVEIFQKRRAEHENWQRIKNEQKEKLDGAVLHPEPGKNQT